MTQRGCCLSSHTKQERRSGDSQTIRENFPESIRIFLENRKVLSIEKWKDGKFPMALESHSESFLTNFGKNFIKKRPIFKLENGKIYLKKRIGEKNLFKFIFSSDHLI